MPARHLHAFALHELALAAGDTAVAVATEPADGHPVTDHEVLHAVAELGHGSCDLVPQCDRPLQSGKVTGVELPVGAAHPAGGDGDARGTGGRRLRFDVDEGQRFVGAGNVHGRMSGHIRTVGSITAIRA